VAAPAWQLTWSSLRGATTRGPLPTCLSEWCAPLPAQGVSVHMCLSTASQVSGMLPGL
jgi:hypothetical protein